MRVTSVPIDDVRVRGSIAIYTHASASESLFVGDLITDGSITSDIPALEPGEYFFRCEAHPAMTGIVVEG